MALFRAESLQIFYHFFATESLPVIVGQGVYEITVIKRVSPHKRLCAVLRYRKVIGLIFFPHPFIFIKKY